MQIHPLWRSSLVCVLALLGSVPTGRAENDGRDLGPIVTDRPDQTESSETVPPGFVQFEAGWVYAEEDEDDAEVRTHTLPGSLLRVGVFERLELRLGWDGYLWEDARIPDDDAGRVSTDTEGGGDASVGLKFFLWEEAGWLPETAFLASVSLPVGREGFSSERVDPAFRFSHAHTISEVMSFGWNWGAAWESELQEEGDDRNTLAVFQYTAALGIALSERVGAFVEAFGDVPLAGDAGPRHSMDGGFTWKAMDNMQLDMSAGFGLSDEADDWFVGVGLSVRLPR